MINQRYFVLPKTKAIPMHYISSSQFSPQHTIVKTIPSYNKYAEIMNQYLSSKPNNKILIKENPEIKEKIHPKFDYIKSPKLDFYKCSYCNEIPYIKFTDKNISITCKNNHDFIINNNNSSNVFANFFKLLPSNMYSRCVNHNCEYKYFCEMHKQYLCKKCVDNHINCNKSLLIDQKNIEKTLNGMEKFTNKLEGTINLINILKNCIYSYKESIEKNKYMTNTNYIIQNFENFKKVLAKDISSISRTTTLNDDEEEQTSRTNNNNIANAPQIIEIEFQSTPEKSLEYHNFLSANFTHLNDPKLFVDDKQIPFKHSEIFPYIPSRESNTHIAKIIFNNRLTTCENMFKDCKGIESIKFSQFDTECVTSMSGMFKNCEDLSHIDVSCFNTRNVKDMSYMFSNCPKLKSIDVSKFITKNVTDMSYMFSLCLGLKELDLRNFDTFNVKDMSFMFHDCFRLEKIQENFRVDNLVNCEKMWEFCGVENVSKKFSEEDCARRRKYLRNNEEIKEEDTIFNEPMYEVNSCKNYNSENKIINYDDGAVRIKPTFSKFSGTINVPKKKKHKSLEPVEVEPIIRILRYN